MAMSDDMRHKIELEFAPTEAHYLETPTYSRDIVLNSPIDDPSKYSLNKYRLNTDSNPKNGFILIHVGWQG